MYNYKWVGTFGRYSIELYLGDSTALSAPTTIDLPDWAVRGLTLNSNVSTPIGLIDANVCVLSIDMDLFDIFQSPLILKSFTSTTNLDVFSITSPFTATYTYADVPCYNYIIIKQDNVIIFEGIQDVLDDVEVEGDVTLNLKFTCVVAKALQYMKPNETVSNGGKLYDWLSVWLYNASKLTKTNYYMDTAVIDIITEGVVVRDEQYRDAVFYVAKIVDVFIYYKTHLNALLTLWRRTSVSATISNPYASNQFYKQNLSTDLKKGAGLAASDVYILISKFKNPFNLLFYSIFCYNSPLSYNSVWELFKVLYSNNFVRAGIDYTTLSLYTIAGYSNSLTTLPYSSKPTSSFKLNENKFIEFNSDLYNSNETTYEKGKPFENNQITLTKSKNGNGNTKRLEVPFVFNNVPIPASNHGYRFLWNATTNNYYAIGYIESLNPSIMGTENVFTRVHDYCQILKKTGDYYAPVEDSTTTTIPYYVNGTGGKFASDFQKWRAGRLMNSTNITFLIDLIDDLLGKDSISVEVEYDDLLDLNLCNTPISFSNYDFLPSFFSAYTDYVLVTGVSLDITTNVTTLNLILYND